MTEDGDSGAAGDVLLWSKYAADGQRHTEDTEEARTHTLLVSEYRLLVDHQVHAGCPVREDRCVIGPRRGRYCLPRGSVERLTGISAPGPRELQLDKRQSIGLGERQRLEQ